ncbi:MAG: hypothetical protein ACLQGP_31895 [Isosphaeraceae bacterium]
MMISKPGSRWLAMAGLSLAPLVFVAVVILELRARFANLYSARGIGWDEMVLIYIGLLISLCIGLYLRRPLLDPSSRWGILAKRAPVRPRLWKGMIVIALSAIFFALTAESTKERRRRDEAFNEQQIAFYTKYEGTALSKAREQERLAAECEAKVARGEPTQGSDSWADRLKFHAKQAAWWRGQIAWASNLRKQMERSP